MTTQLQPSVAYLTREEIEDRAADVLRHHGLEMIPVDPVALAARIGITVHNAKFADDSISGMIAKRGDEVMLLVDRDDSPYRKRFTIAHEIGHHFLHLQGDGEFVDGEANLFRQQHNDPQTDPTDQRRQEIQANLFASALLMPADKVREAWKLTKSVDQLARQFVVSAMAMGYRIDSLGLQ